MILTFIILFILFIAWALLQKDDMSTSSDKMARNLLTGKREKRERTKKVEAGDVELTGLERNSSSFFESSNPMRDDGLDDAGMTDKAWSEDDLGGGQRRESNWKKAVDEDGNEYSYDETSGRTTWSDKSQADDGD